MNNNKYWRLPLFVFISFLYASCATKKNVAYFQDFKDTTARTSVVLPAYTNPVIHPDDILNITIQTLDKDVNLLFANPTSFTQPSSAGALNVAGQQVATPGYLVDANGEIELPFTGKIKVQGLTTIQAKEVIRNEVGKTVKDPLVNLKFANFKITVLGEVARPGTYIMPNEKVTVLDALGLAGDLTIYGRRDNILLMRDSLNSEKNMMHLDLNSKNVISSPYYYLHSNDVVYVEPNKNKVESTDVNRTRNITIYASALSVLIVLLTRLN